MTHIIDSGVARIGRDRRKAPRREVDAALHYAEQCVLLSALDVADHRRELDRADVTDEDHDRLDQAVDRLVADLDRLEQAMRPES